MYLNNPPVPPSKYLKSKNKIIKEAKHIYKPSESVKEYITKKPAEPLFRQLNKNQTRSNFSLEKFRAIVRDAKERQVRGDQFKDERMLTNL